MFYWLFSYIVDQIIGTGTLDIYGKKAKRVKRG